MSTTSDTRPTRRSTLRALLVVPAATTTATAPAAAALALEHPRHGSRLVKRDKPDKNKKHKKDKGKKKSKNKDKNPGRGDKRPPSAEPGVPESTAPPVPQAESSQTPRPESPVPPPAPTAPDAPQVPQPGSAGDVDRFAPGNYPATTVLTPEARHLVNRFSYGITPALAADVVAAGGHLAWFDAQIAAASNGVPDDLCDWWPDLHRGPLDLYQRSLNGTRAGSLVMVDYGRRSVLRRIVSSSQVLEVMTEFWENHFHVPSFVDNVYTYRADYGMVIRAHALGRFEDLLQAAILHPAMLLYLGAYASTKVHPNENLGRELLELHTVGLGRYVEDDVKSSARILTGYKVDAYKTWVASYQPASHWTGAVRVMDFQDANVDADGRAVAQRYLSYLARHPATAQRLATKLARAFVSDTPTQGLVDRLATTFLDSDTAIAPVLRELVRTDEFQRAIDAKLRDADEDMAASYRVLGVQVGPPTASDSAANLLTSQVGGLGLTPFAWPRPDGQPLDNASWATPSRVMASMNLHWNLAGGRHPGKDVSYRSPSSWWPTASPMPFRDLVDHLSRLVLHRASTARLLEACCIAVDIDPGAIVAPGGELDARWSDLLTTLLDSPDFYLR